MKCVGAKWSSGEDRYIALLNRVGERIAETTSACDVLNEVVEEVVATLDCDVCTIYLSEGDHFVLQASLGHVSEVDVRVARKSGSINPRLSTVLISERAYSDPRFLLFNNRFDGRCEAFLSVPMVSGDRLVGVINIQNHTRQQYTDREVDLLSTLGLMVGTAVEIDRLKSQNACLAQNLESCEDIEQATRILQSELALSQPDAYLLLQKESRQRRKSMKDVAAAIILSDELRTKNPSSCPSDQSNTPLGNPRLLS
jgi:uroporphyrinogen-III synthase